MAEGGQPERAQPATATDPAFPLCVDLDGTLLRGDSLVESLIRLLRTQPLSLARVPGWLARGRARLKHELALRVALDPASLPYDDRLLDYLRGERAAGRPLFLATASHQRLARAVAEHLGIFSGVIATDERTNLKGRAKRDELVRRFGERGFDYAGDSAADLEVWRGARLAIVVNAPPRVVRKLEGQVKLVLESRRRFLPRVVLEAMRVRQWVKNLLLLLPVALAHRLLEPRPAGMAVLAFVAFGLGASAVYVLNDLLDVEADRHHPVKRARPFASGELGLGVGIVLVPLLALPAVGIALLLPRPFVLVLLLYFALTTAYSLFLKQVVLADVLLLAGLYTLRIIAGAAASEVVVSQWLLAFSMFFFLSLAAVKRYAELRRLRTERVESVVRGRGYLASDLELMAPIGLSTGYLAVLVLALYISSDSVTPLYSYPTLLWFVCPLLLYWISRIWFLAHRGQVQDDPLSFAVRDPATWVVALATGAIALAASGIG